MDLEITTSFPSKGLLYLVVEIQPNTVQDVVVMNLTQTVKYLTKYMITSPRTGPRLRYCDEALVTAAEQ